MDSQVYPDSETNSATFGTYPDDLPTDPFVSSMFEDPVFGGDLAYGYLTHETNGVPPLHFSDWLAYPMSAGYAYTGLAAPPSSMENPSDPPAPLPSPPPQEPPSPEHSAQPPPQPNCRQGTPSFNYARRKWSCSVCGDAFHDKYECERHIGNVGKQATCLACGKTICARKDSRKRHYTKFCKRMDLGKDGNLSLEDAFIEV